MNEYTDNALPQVAQTGLIPAVEIIDGRPMAESRDVAKFFEREHKVVLRAIRELNCSGEFIQCNFAPVKAKDLTGEFTSHVMMTVDGFMFLAMGFTGSKAARIKELYIARFREMEKALQNKPAIPDFNDPAFVKQALLYHLGEEIRLMEQVKEQQTVIDAQAPKVAALEEISESEGSMCITSAGKILGFKQKEIFDHLRAIGWIYKQGGIWRPYETSRNKGYMEMRLKFENGQSFEQTMVTALGITKLAAMQAAVRPVNAMLFGERN